MSRTYKYSTIVLYIGEIYRFQQPDCWQFDSVAEAADWLVKNGHAKNMQAAKTGISNVLNGKLRHYKGFTISVAYVNSNTEG